MQEREFYAYHLVTRKKMDLGQIISSDKNQKNTLYHFFFEKEQLNSKGEDFLQILESHFNDDGLKLDKENADVAVKYVGQTIRANTAKSYQDALKWEELFEGDGSLLPKEDGTPFSRKIEQARE